MRGLLTLMNWRAPVLIIYTRAMKLLRRILPSKRPAHDPISMATECAHPSLKPVYIYNLNLTWPVTRQIVSQRHKSLNPVREDGHKLSVIIPYRDRHEHLSELLPALREHLDVQGIDFEILVIEQEFGKPFNKGMMMNIGAHMARPESDYLCFNDVDTVPLKSADYRYCSLTLRPYGVLHADHDVSWLNSEDGQVYSHCFGGVIILPRDTFGQLNGFNNGYWHWGCEDDDFLLRHLFAGLAPVYDTEGEFRLIYHPHTLHCYFDGTYTDDPAKKKVLESLTWQNSRRYRKFRRGLVDSPGGLDTCAYKELARREELGATIITVSV